MATVFCRLTAELSPEFIQNFSCQFDVNAMVSKVCEDNNLDISYQDQNLFIHGDWSGVGCAHNMLVTAMEVYGSSTDKKNNHLASRPFSALVEAAEAISREVEFQENEAKLMNSNALDHDSSGSKKNQLEANAEFNSFKCENDLSSGYNLELFTNEMAIRPGAKYSTSVQIVNNDSSIDGDNMGPCNNLRLNDMITKESELKHAELLSGLKHEMINEVPNYKCNKKSSIVKKEKITGIYECDVCKKQYKKKKSLVVHMKSHHEIQIKQELSNTETSVEVSPIDVKDIVKEKRFLCQKCGKCYSTKHSLLEHMNSHLGIKPYKCTECGKSFAYEPALRDHRYTHNQDRYFVCKFPDCEKSFRQRSTLKAHEKIHADTKQFVCLECGHGFTQKHALQRHERSHKGHKPFKCKLCGRMFGDTSIARRHIRLVHKLNKELGVWREDIEEVIEENELDKPSEETEGNEQTQGDEVSEVGTDVLETGEDRPASEQNPMDMGASDENTVIQSNAAATANNIQSVFVNYNNLPEQHIVSDPSPEFHEVAPVVQHNFLNTISKLDTQDNIKAPANSLSLLQPEHETYVIERDQIHFLTENLDGTLNTSTIDFSRLKKNYEQLSKPNAYLDINAVSDQFGETLKPDGTVGDLPMDSSFENLSKFSDNDQLSEHLGLSMPQFQFSVNQYFNMNQSSILPGLSNSEPASSD